MQLSASAGESECRRVQMCAMRVRVQVSAGEYKCR